jgi:hypothetical protein
VAIIGDVDSDGRADFAIGAPGFDGTAGTDCGRVTIHSGATGATLFTLEGTTAGERFGASVCELGDTDGDGVPDVGVGSPSFDGTAGADSGRIAFISGTTGTEIRSLEGAQAGAALGTSVGPAGDLDNDARRDLVAGAPLFAGAGGADTGLVLVVSGRDTSVLLTLEGTSLGDRLGTSVGGGGDIDRDGFDDIVVGAPGFDGSAGPDSGITSVLSGQDGSLIFDLEGTSDGDAQGTAVAGLGDVLGSGRLVVATGAPGRDLSGTDRGQVTSLRGDRDASSVVSAYETGSHPRMAAVFDADGDGDNDLIIVNETSVSILWNGDRVGGPARALFDEVERLDLPLSPGANGVCVAAGQFDGDAACEIVVGRDDGSVDVFDGTGSGAGAVFALTPASPFTVDGSVAPGPIASLAVLGSGPGASVVCAGAGSAVIPGFISRIIDPSGSPSLSAPLLSGGSFSSVVVGDIDGDQLDDIVAANASTTAAGGVHVLDGASSFAPVMGSPFDPTATPRVVALCDLDGDNVKDDVATASVSFAGGGVRVLLDFQIATGFAGTLDPGLAVALSVALSVAAGSLDALPGDDLCVLDGLGNLVVLTGFDGMAFAPPLTPATTVGPGVELACGQFTAGGAQDPCDPDEIVTVHLATDLSNVLRFRRAFDVSSIAMTGCPILSPVSRAAVTRDPIIGTFDARLSLTGATPLSLCLLVIQINPVGTSPIVDTTSGCGIAMTMGPLAQYFTFTNALGGASVLTGLPDDPCLVGDQFVVQFGVLDGGPLLGVFTVSDALLVTIGEN